ncbi:unnamed protein product [Diabrotica balteata]|uniref:Acyltransferase 3 domain-containing protein n=1 Tax=Diabrotica balteata TaxID=107213 RepID=A0A9N9SMS9_DIABA|nr:unnamed protein product [Diabrotica balteata]
MITKCRDLLLKTPSIYLFVNPKFDKPIRGYEVISKYAKLCGAKNPSALTCTRLRKHLATLTQLFTMSENDMEQLASFMGHTLGIHRSSYRLPDDIYQTVKISKLLLLMEKGKAGQFKGKSLEEIEINLEEDIMEDDDGHNDEVFGEQKNEINDVIESKGPECSNNEKKGIMDMKAKNKKRVLVPWTENQKKVVKMYFKTHIKQKMPPKKSECEDLILKNPDILKNKNWLKIKVFVQNEYKKVNVGYFEGMYLPTKTRLPPYFIGIIFGYIVYKYKNLKLRRPIRYLAWVAVIGTMFGLILVHLVYTRATSYNPVRSALFNGFARQLWAIAQGCFIILCLSDKNGLMNQVLSLPIFQRLVRLSYSFYLTHLIVIWYFVGSKRSAVFYTNINTIHDFLGDSIFTFIISIFWCLAFESPFVALGQLMSKRKGKPSHASSDMDLILPLKKKKEIM